MRVRRNFEELYTKELDPWSIGDADSSRYNYYQRLITLRLRPGSRILDIGCGKGAFLSRFRRVASKLIGVEISETAVSRGKQKYPYIQFIHGSADKLRRVLPDTNLYETIIYSDVIYYLKERSKRVSLNWIANHLAADGFTFIAAWCPGGQYLEYDELKRLVQYYFNIEEEHMLESKHAIFIAKRKRRLVAITVDYETWQPIPEGKSIDWEKDVFQPTRELLRVFNEEKVKITLMVEMGEYFWLKQNQPNLAAKMERQWTEVLRQGHDVQLHLHPNWLPELGARYMDGKWEWDWSKAKLDDYQGNLDASIAKCKTVLESVLSKAKSGYHVTCFRAGGYRVQPFKRLHGALKRNGIVCDSSVYAGGYSIDRGYDFSLAYSSHQPYFANPYDPQLKAPYSEQDLIEVPIFTFRPGERCFIDNYEGKRFAQHILDNLDRQAKRFLSSETYRQRKKFRELASSVYRWLASRGIPNLLVPKRLAYLATAYEHESLAGNEYFVIIGHTKANLYFEEIAANLRKLKERRGLDFVTMSEMVGIAKEDLISHTAKERSTLHNEVKPEGRTFRIRGPENKISSRYLEDMVPLDRNVVLNLSCGTGNSSAHISRVYPWMKITDVNCSHDAVAEAKKNFSSDMLSYVAGQLVSLTFLADSFDCVFADNTLQREDDIDKVISEIYRVLRYGGMLIAAITSDARNPCRAYEGHSWKSVPHEVRMRLSRAGFLNIEIQEVDTYRKMGMGPYPPSLDKMMFIKAWKRPREVTKLERATEAMDWVYHAIQPRQCPGVDDPLQILRQGYALCWGYAVVLGKLLKRESFDVRWVTMLVTGHPRGVGTDKVDSHDVLQVRIDSQDVILDPTANTCIPHSLGEVLMNPELAKQKENPDKRYVERGYDLYDTSFWYSRVFKYSIRSDVNKRIIWRTLNRKRTGHEVKIVGRV